MDPQFKSARPNHIYSVDELMVCSDTFGGSSQSHPFYYCDADLMAQMATKAEHVAHGGKGHGRKIFLSREGMARRRLSDEAQLLAALQAEGFVAVRMEDLSGADQLATVTQADVIVGPHGSTLTSLLAMRPGSGCVEMSNPQKGTLGFALIAARRGLRYAPVFGASEESDAWSVDIAQVLQAVLGGSGR